MQSACAGELRRSLRSTFLSKLSPDPGSSSAPWRARRSINLSNGCYTFPMTSYNKLVRDKIPELLDSKGISYEKRIASTEEYRVELVKKMQEEAAEFAEAGSPEELADILEVADALRKLPEYQDVVALQQKKRKERGGFEERLILKGERG